MMFFETLNNHPITQNSRMSDNHLRHYMKNIAVPFHTPKYYPSNFESVNSILILL